MSKTVRTILRGFWLVGVAALVVSAAGAGWTLYSSPGNGAGRSGSPAPAAAETGRVLGVVVGYVDVKHGVRALYPVVAGRVEQVNVEENDRVQAGQVLLSLDRELAELQVNLAKADLRAAQVQLDRARKGPEQQKVLEAEQQAAIDAAKHDVTSAEQVLARAEKLKNLNGDAGQHEIQGLQAQVEKARAALRGQQDKMAELKLNDPQLDIRRAEADVTAKEAQLAKAQKGLKECDLRAPGAGTIMRLLVGKGDVLGANGRQPAIVFCPDEPRIIRAELDQEAASRVQVGQRATVEDDTRSGEEWRATVEHVAESYLQRRSTMLDPFAFNDSRILECLLKLDPGKAPPRFGQRVRVKLLDTRGH
jgi:multidrug resistance efflux pump